MTREEAIKVCTREKECIRQALGECAEGDKYVSPDGIITAIDYVEALGMAIAALRERPQWISVEDRLPDVGQRVLVWCQSRMLTKHVTVSTYMTTYSGKRRTYFSRRVRNVTNWMPLPEKPKEEV